MRFILLLSLVCLFSSSYSQETDSLIDFNSLASVFTIAKKGEKALWTGTSFFVQLKKTIYIITNNHIIGGKYHTDEFKRLHASDGKIDTLPDIITIRLYDKKVNRFYFQSVALTDSKDNPLYIKFYENEADANTLLDVVAIPIKGTNMIDAIKLNGYGDEFENTISLFPGQDLFVVGFPGGINPIYPIWKRGTIATEPNLLPIGGSTFLIDATTRKGMSGSPVVFRGSTTANIGGGTSFYTGNVTRLIGVYSAQIYELELGTVTRMEKIFKKLRSISE